MAGEIRVRIAPSPTGYLHLGTARTALYNWLFARHYGGRFILRIEDTDRDRNTPQAVDVIIEGLRWLGLDWDEGPIFQSERFELYKSRAEELLSKGLARKDRLGRADMGECVVFDCPRRDIGFEDLVKGQIVKAAADLEPHIVLLRSDGWPTYNFACVVDDIDMRITHVIRGDDHVANTWKQLLLYEALGVEPPKFAHLPMIHNTEGKKLSKRDGAVAITDYRLKGYLPDAMVNYLALLGWSPGDGTELMSREELVRRFDLSRVRPSPAQFDFVKFEWMNAQYIAQTPVEKLIELLKPFIEEAGFKPKDEAWLARLVEVERKRMKTLRDFVGHTRFLFLDDIRPDPNDANVRKVLSQDGVWRIVDTVADRLSKLDEANWKRDLIESELKAVAAELAGGKMGAVGQPVRVLVTGSTASPAIDITLELLGRQKTLERLRDPQSRRAFGG